MHKIYKRRELPWQNIDDKTLVLQSEQGEVHELNATASFIWNELKETISLEQLVEKFSKNSQHRTQVEKDFRAFLKDLAAKQLIDCHE